MLQPVVDKRWPERRERARELADRWAFAAEVLELYTALLDVQERAFETARDDRPLPDRLAHYAAQTVLPKIIAVSAAHGPSAMIESVVSSSNDMELESTIDAWLRGKAVGSVERYLARASTGPILEALGANVIERAPSERDDRRCPACGGLPQLSYFASSSENLVTARRYLVCSRCASVWPFARLTCAGCGENETKNLLVYGELGTTQAEISENIIKARTEGTKASGPVAQFPHLRIDGCRTCSHYLLCVDLERDQRAIPIVDELAAIPLSLYAAEHGLTKIVPNLMGF